MLHADIKLTSGEVVRVSGDFEQDELETLRAYSVEAQRLDKVPLLQQPNIHMSIKMDFEVGSGSVERPSDEDIAVLLMRLRPFILQKEHCNFGTVKNIIRRRIPDKSLQQITQKLSSLYLGENMLSLMKVEAGGVLINSDEVLMDWLNGFEYHRDKKKRARIEQLHPGGSLELSMPIFMNLLLDKVTAIRHLSALVRLLLQSGNYCEAAP